MRVVVVALDGQEEVPRGSTFHAHVGSLIFDLWIFVQAPRGISSVWPRSVEEAERMEWRGARPDAPYTYVGTSTHYGGNLCILAGNLSKGSPHRIFGWCVVCVVRTCCCVRRHCRHQCDGWKDVV